MDSKSFNQMDVAVDLIDRYHAATNRRVYVTDKLTSILLGNDESEWLMGFQEEVIRKEDDLRKLVD
jgi:hypothetical protein